MADKTGIEWTESTWNPLRGCTRVSPGCGGANREGGCYAEGIAARFSDPGQPFHGFATRTPAGPRWTGKVALVEALLDLPLRWKKPRTIFVNSMSDLFHEDVPDQWIDRIFAVMALCPQHTFQVLTKRSARMRAYMANVEREAYWMNTVAALLESIPSLMRQCHPILARREPWLPLPNVWLGVSCEDQARADERVPDLLATPAAVRFVSAEPLLGPIDFDSAWHGESALDSECWGDCGWCDLGYPPLHNCRRGNGDDSRGRSGLDWIIVGGESGPRARPMHPDWARSIRDQCTRAGVPFFFKQWGEHAPSRDSGPPLAGDVRGIGDHMVRVGKKRAGRRLDGREHNAMPEVRP